MPARTFWRQLLIFKAGWFGLVLLGNWGALVVMPVLMWLMTQLTVSQRHGVLLLVVLGLALDSAQLSAGVFNFAQSTAEYRWLPFWLVVLWGWFGWCWVSTLQYWLSSPLLALLFGCVAGPLAYRAGAALNPAALSIEAPVWFWPLQALGWGMLMLVWLQWQQCERQQER